MRDPAFPMSSINQKDYSTERETPHLHGAQEIPIDPTIVTHEEPNWIELVRPFSHPFLQYLARRPSEPRSYQHWYHVQSIHTHLALRATLLLLSPLRFQYSLPTPNPQHPTPNLLTPVPMQPKRKQSPIREEECSFCRGNDNGNEHGRSELMVTCVTCGRSGKLSAISIPDPPRLLLSGHPTCMDLGPVAEIMRPNPGSASSARRAIYAVKRAMMYALDLSFLASCPY